MSRITFILLSTIILLSMLVRVYRFNAPMVDLHSWRQSDTAAVARNLVNDNFDFLHPRILSAVSIDGMGRDNVNRYHFAEFPLYQMIVAAVSYLSGDVVKAGRMVSIAFSLFSIIVLYFLARRYYSEQVTLLSAFVFGMLPYNFFWSRAVLPDSMMVLFCLLTLYFYDRWIRGPSGKQYRLAGYLIDLNYVLSMVSFALAMLLKAFPLFLIIPMAILYVRKVRVSWVPFALLAAVPIAAWSSYLQIYAVNPNRTWLFPLVVGMVCLELYLVYHYRKYLLEFKIFVLFIVLSLVPFIAWRVWISQWPASIPASNWLFDGKHLRLKPAWWHWIFQDRLDRLMFNFSGLFLIGLGLLFHKEMVQPLTWGVEQTQQRVSWILRAVLGIVKEFFAHVYKRSDYKHVAKMDRSEVEDNWFFPICFASCLLYFVIFATGNVTHEYYQIVIIPFGSVLLSAGFWYMWEKGYGFWELSLRRLIAIALVGVTLILGWYSVRNWYIIANPMIPIIGKRADLLLPKDALVIAPYGGDTTFLYYINRPGWSVVDKKIQAMIDQGATHFISNYRDESTNRLARLYKVVEETPEYVILDLREKSDDPEWSTISPYDL